MFIVEIESFSNVFFNILTMGKMQRIWGMYEKLGKSEKNTISSNRKKESAVDRAGEHKKNSKDSIGFEALQPLHISQRKMKEMINGGCNPKQVAQRDLAHVCNNTEKVSNPAKVNQHKSNQQLNKYTRNKNGFSEALFIYSTDTFATLGINLPAKGIPT